MSPWMTIPYSDSLASPQRCSFNSPVNAGEVVFGSICFFLRLFFYVERL